MRRIAIAIVIIFGFVSLGYTIYREAENNVAGMTIVVKTPDQKPIPHTIIRLENFHRRTAVQNQTNGRGELRFQRLASGTYIIRATQIYCEGGKRGAQTLAIDISDSNTIIYYFPCGNQ